MLELITLYFGTMLLLELSQLYYPAGLRARLRRRTPGGTRSDIFLLAAIFWMTCFCFLRTDYNDTGAYIVSFWASPSPRQFVASGELLNFTGNPLFYFYESLMHRFAPNSHLFFLPVSGLMCYTAVTTFKRYSVFPAFSLMIYYSIGTFLLYMAAMKQCIAMSILLLSIPYVLERKYLRFAALVVLAALFHTYAIMFLVVPLLCGRPWSFRTWVMLAGAVFAMVTFQSTLGAVVDYAQSIGAHASEDDLFDNNSINILRVAVYLVPALIALVFRRRLFRDSSRAENLFTNLSILSGLILMIGLAQGANLMARMAGFFEIGAALCLPWMIRKIFTRSSARVVSFMAGVMYFGYFFYEIAITKKFDSDYSAISLWQFLSTLFQ